jgi:hypothetical protein
MMANVQKQQMLERDDYLRFRLPEALKERFKLYCYLKGITMSDTVREMIEGSSQKRGLRKALTGKTVTGKEKRQRPRRTPGVS